jgi:hypothetical protein
MRTICQHCCDEIELSFSLSFRYACAKCGHENSAVGTPPGVALRSDATNDDRDFIATLIRISGDSIRIASVLREHLSFSAQASLELVRGPLPVRLTQVSSARWHKLEVLREALAAEGAEVELSRASLLRPS